MDFAETFECLTGHRPMPWQVRLFGRMRTGDLPRALDLPTGLGKTSVMAVWLAARLDGAPLPRRLVYVVDRRVVVDQATAEADGLAERLGKVSPAPAGRRLADRAIVLAAPHGRIAVFCTSREVARKVLDRPARATTGMSTWPPKMPTATGVCQPRRLQEGQAPPCRGRRLRAGAGAALRPGPDSGYRPGWRRGPAGRKPGQSLHHHPARGTGNLTARTFDGTETGIRRSPRVRPGARKPTLLYTPAGPWLRRSSPPFRSQHAWRRHSHPECARPGADLPGPGCRRRPDCARCGRAPCRCRTPSGNRCP